MWTHNNEEVKEVSEDYYGFVYLITCLVDGKKYVGKKFLWKKTKKTETLKNGKKRKKSVLVESDWRKYYGSSDDLKAHIALHGKENFTREILYFCKSKGECSYFEAYEQFSRKVLLDDSYFNKWIMVRVRKDHLIKTSASID